MNLNLIMAGVWLIVAVAWFGAMWVRGDLSYLPPVFALVLCGYNLVRWRLRPRRRGGDPLAETLEARRRMHREAEERPHGPPDPNFNFTDPPAAPDPRRSDPPSPN